MFTTPESRWRALQTRNPRSASAFIYAVTTTRIFCRPTCPARLARHANVVFFDAAADAAAQGFRACKRCKPAQEDFASTRMRHESSAKKACEVIDAAGGKIDLETLASRVGLSPRYLHGVFKQVVGVTPGTYAAKLRMGMEKTEKTFGESCAEVNQRGDIPSPEGIDTQLLDPMLPSMGPVTDVPIALDAGLDEVLHWIAMYGESNTSTPDTDAFQGLDQGPPQPLITYTADGSLEQAPDYQFLLEQHENYLFMDTIISHEPTLLPPTK